MEQVTITERLIEEPAGQVLEEPAGVIEVLTQGIKGAAERVVKKVQNAGELLAEKAEHMRENVAETAHIVTDKLLSSTKEVLREQEILAEKAAENLKRTAASAYKTTESVAETISETTAEVASAAKKAVSETATKAMEIGSETVGKVTEKAEEVVEKATATVEPVISEAKEKAAEVFEYLAPKLPIQRIPTPPPFGEEVLEVPKEAHEPSEKVSLPPVAPALEKEEKELTEQPTKPAVEKPIERKEVCTKEQKLEELEQRSELRPVAPEEIPEVSEEHLPTGAEAAAQMKEEFTVLPPKVAIPEEVATQPVVVAKDIPHVWEAGQPASTTEVAWTDVEKTKHVVESLEADRQKAEEQLKGAPLEQHAQPEPITDRK